MLADYRGRLRKLREIPKITLTSGLQLKCFPRSMQSGGKFSSWQLSLIENYTSENQQGAQEIVYVFNENTFVQWKSSEFMADVWSYRLSICNYIKIISYYINYGWLYTLAVNQLTRDFRWHETWPLNAQVTYAIITRPVYSPQFQMTCCLPWGKLIEMWKTYDFPRKMVYKLVGFHIDYF